MQDDIELVNRVISGDVACFSLLVRQYEQGIMRFIFNMVKNNETTEDLCQEVFIAAYYKLYSYKKEYKFSTWLYTIANNKCIDYLRKNKKSKEVNLEDISLFSREASPDMLVELKETKETLECFIKALKDVDRKILALRSSEEKHSFYDIAMILSMSKSNVKKRYYNILEKYEKLKRETENSFEKGVI